MYEKVLALGLIPSICILSIGFAGIVNRTGLRAPGNGSVKRMMAMNDTSNEVIDQCHDYPSCRYTQLYGQRTSTVFNTIVVIVIITCP